MKQGLQPPRPALPCCVEYNAVDPGPATSTALIAWQAAGGTCTSATAAQQLTADSEDTMQYKILAQILQCFDSTLITNHFI